MPKFRKKPVVIEAEQFFRDKLPWPKGVVECPVYEKNEYVGTLPHISTLEGPHLVSEGDWIITGVKGERYARKPDIFEMTYEPAE